MRHTPLDTIPGIKFSLQEVKAEGKLNSSGAMSSLGCPTQHFFFVSVRIKTNRSTKLFRETITFFSDLEPKLSWTETKWNRPKWRLTRQKRRITAKQSKTNQTRTKQSETNWINRVKTKKVGEQWTECCRCWRENLGPYLNGADRCIWGLGAKSLDRRPCTGRSQEAVVIFIFGLEALLTRESRVLPCAVSSSPKL